MDILNAAREEAVLKSRAQQAGDPALAQSVMALFTEIMRLSREEQRRYLEEQTETKRIAYSGVPGRVQRVRGGRFLWRRLRARKFQDV